MSGKILRKLNGTFFVAIVTSLVLSLSGCTNSNDGYSETEYAKGEHQIVEVVRDFNPFFGRDGLYGLTAPEGYQISDYDYDKTDNFEFHDYVYENVVPVTVLNPDNIGTPVAEVSEDGTLYEAGRHVIVDINRNFSFLFGKGDQVFHLTAPNGYRVLDYDYDKTDSFEFENITYVNDETVEVSDIHSFGSPATALEERGESSTYDVGEDIMVVIHRGFNPFWGKDEMKEVGQIPGYQVVDYDYDKTDSLEFETIVYQNTVPVVVEVDDTIGTPVEEISSYDHSDGVYDTNEHVLVDINRDFNFLFGYEGTKQVNAPDGYEVLDYDYDMNDSFEFETTVYINTEPVEVSDSNQFGKVYQKTRE